MIYKYRIMKFNVVIFFNFRNDPNFCGLTILIKDMDQTLETAMSNLNIQLDNKGIDHDLKTTTDTKNEKNHPDGKKEESKLESSGVCALLFYYYYY